MSSGQRPSAPVAVAFGLVVVILGSNWVAARFSNEELPPAWGAALRFAAAAVILFGVAAVRRIPIPRGQAAVGAAAYGLLVFGANFGLIYFALLEVPAGTASVVFAFIPLATLVLVAVHRIERFHWRGLIGSLAAVAGITIIFAARVGAAGSLVHLAAVVVAVFCAAEGTVLIKMFPRSHPIATNAVGMAAGTGFLLVISLAAGESWFLPGRAKTWLAVAWLVVAGSTMGFVLLVYVIQKWTASASSYSAVLAPLVTVAVAAWLAGERVQPAFAVGGLLVLVGTYIGAVHGSMRRPPPLPPSAVDPVADHALPRVRPP